MFRTAKSASNSIGAPGATIQVSAATAPSRPRHQRTYETDERRGHVHPTNIRQFELRGMADLAVEGLGGVGRCLLFALSPAQGLDSLATFLHPLLKLF
jgi:hypothetical protein